MEIPVDETMESQVTRSSSYSGSRVTEGMVGMSALTDLRLDSNKLLIVPPDVVCIAP